MAASRQLILRNDEWLRAKSSIRLDYQQSLNNVANHYNQLP
jgi:hypothetical protein